MSSWFSIIFVLSFYYIIFSLLPQQNHNIIFSYMMARTSYIRWSNIDVALYYTLSWIFIVLAHWNNSWRVDMSFHTRTYYHDYEPNSLCIYSLMLHAWRRNSRHQFYYYWFDPTGTRSLLLLGCPKQPYNVDTMCLHCRIWCKQRLVNLHQILIHNCNRNVDLVGMTRFWIDLHHVCSKSNYLETI